MSLNRIEEQLFDYLQRHPDERHFVQYKVRECAAAADPERAVFSLTEELSAYYRERRQVVPEFSALPSLGGASKHSLRNLAEYLLRVWSPTKNNAQSRDKSSPSRK